MSSALIRQPDAVHAGALARQDAAAGALIKAQAPRTSKLQAPIMLLTGHESDVHTVKFAHSGEFLASGSFDRNIYLWNIYGDCKNWGVMSGHTNAVLDVQWSRDNSQIFSASADHTVGVWDVESATRVKKGKGHSGIVTCLATTRRGQEFYASGSDDTKCHIWDPRVKRPVDTIETSLPVTSLAFAEAGDVLFTGSVDNVIKAWDTRARAVAYTLTGHADTVTGLSLSPDGTSLASYAWDDTLRVWDVKPFSAIASRCTAVLAGATPHDAAGGPRAAVPAWDPSGQYLACASAGDRTVVVWDVPARSVKYKLPGHKGAVTSVDWHPTEPVVASGGVDRAIYLGELAV
ncbi:hypothetical protein AMAG_06211 [Allomyces macrogynus ATCC 38327]|uniref:Uncharacterized protein n=1 Tax=Allomyces macrogynus (strain ATCC 38327) TaxID=578462 RepID=A0A0L0SG02_ALLM3|nr:hypothetical protein AMAG_06211 [Allomyces macrogynus ATCC 38327]|eukprot:KNE61382.1 hypothetical protein AMAG_06211 [Allomyces macrogynus ATCC 38327]